MDKSGVVVVVVDAKSNVQCSTQNYGVIITTLNALSDRGAGAESSLAREKRARPQPQLHGDGPIAHGAKSNMGSGLLQLRRSSKKKDAWFLFLGLGSFGAGPCAKLGDGSCPMQAKWR